MHCLSYEWISPADGVAGLEWIDCTGTLPEWILSLSTTSGSIISQHIIPVIPDPVRLDLALPDYRGCGTHPNDAVMM